MRRLGKTTADLARLKRRWEQMTALLSEGQAAGPSTGAVPSRLKEERDFGSNPGNLRLWTYVPANLPAGAALVVVLHGCKQNAAGYDHGTGWSALAERCGFAVLVPEQQGANNPNHCFNWFQPGDTTRGRGEALSIRQMVEAVVAKHGIDRRRIFVTGLSAGGAMASVMLATYPDVFAGGAIIAGLPYGCAGNVQEALDAMFQGRSRSPAEWGGLVRAASRHTGPWPAVSVWHGSADATVKPMNADEIVKQWLDVHGLQTRPEEDRVDGFPHRVWRGADGRVLVESYTITGMAHGTPLSVTAEAGIGAVGPFLLDVGISSTHRIAESWGLLDAARPRAEATAAQPSHAPAPALLHGEVLGPDKVVGGSENGPAREAPGAGHRTGDIQSVITGALRAAGLIRS